MPAAVALMSPALDLTSESATSRDLTQRDPVLSHAFGKKCLSAYFGDAPFTEPRLDVWAADKRGWPPMLIQVGDHGVRAR